MQVTIGFVKFNTEGRGRSSIVATVLAATVFNAIAYWFVSYGLWWALTTLGLLGVSYNLWTALALAVIAILFMQK